MGISNVYYLVYTLNYRGDIIPEVICTTVEKATEMTRIVRENTDRKSEYMELPIDSL